MTPEPKMSDRAPYQWVGAVVLSPDDVKELINELPADARLADQLRRAAQAAERLADRLNEIEHPRRAA